MIGNPGMPFRLMKSSVPRPHQMWLLQVSSILFLSPAVWTCAISTMMVPMRWPQLSEVDGRLADICTDDCGYKLMLESQSERLVHRVLPCVCSIQVSDCGALTVVVDPSTVRIPSAFIIWLESPCLVRKVSAMLTRKRQHHRTTQRCH